MKKKFKFTTTKLLLFTFIFLTTSLFAKDLNVSPPVPYIFRYYENPVPYIDFFCMQEHEIIEGRFINKNEIRFFKVHDFSNIKNEKGFRYFESKKGSRTYFLNGKNIFIPIFSNGFDINKNSLTSDEKSQGALFIDTKYKGAYHENFGRKTQIYFIVDDGIKNITASSYLQEQEIAYFASNLKERLYLADVMSDYHGLLYDSITPPWAEGVSGYGIDEYLICEFNNSVDEIQILNGFVDFRRPALYKKNSRVKKFLIESENPKFSKEYSLEDEVKFSVLKLPQKTNQIKITIKDIYKGDKYDDTCLSAIVAFDSDIFDDKKIESFNNILLKSSEKDLYTNQIFSKYF